VDVVLTLAGSRQDAKDHRQKEAKRSEIVNDITGILKLYHELKVVEQGQETARVPSSIMLQILKYGKTFKRVIEHVEYDVSSFNTKFNELVERGRVVRLSKTFYRHKWVEPPVEVPKEDVERIMEPLENLGLGEFKFMSSLRYNSKFEEAVKEYVETGKVLGKVVYDEKKNRLIVFSTVVGERSLGKYHTLFVFEPSPDGGIKTTYSCTCPWARGETTDRRGRLIPPEYTSICKHGIATLFYYYPEMATYLKLASEGKLSKAEFDKLVSKTRKAFDEMHKRLEDYLSKNPEASGVVMSNVAYIVTRELYRKFHEVGTPMKYVPSVSELPEVASLWSTLFVKRRVTVEVEGAPTTRTVDVKGLIEKIEKAGVYGRIEKLERLLNGLQGSRTPTLYTRALLAGLVLGSDLETDPVMVSVVGDPGTGKTLTAEGLARLVGIRSLVMEKDVEETSLRDEVMYQLGKRVARYLEFFASVIEPRIPPDKRDEARKFLEEYIEKVPDIIGKASTKDMIRFAKQFGETFTRLYGVADPKLKKTVGKLFYDIMKFYKKMYQTYLTRKAIERRALEERRKLLALMSKLGLITRPEEKEEVNSGSVRWEILETAKGYKVRVVVDLHYMLKRFGGDVDKVLEALKEMANHGKIYLRTEVPGIAELKLSEAEYLEKALRVREEDILSPARRLIWVGGELTKKAVILIDESRRAPELLERLLTDLSTAARDTRRTNIVVTTDNAEPLMEAERDPRLDAFHSRVNFEVITPSTTVAYVISETLKEISELERSGKVPLITLDEALLLNMVAEHVAFPERYETVLYAVPLLLIYDFKVLRPEIVASMMYSLPEDKVNAPPMLLPVPKGAMDTTKVVGDYMDTEWGTSLPGIRMMPERRFGHHVVRASKALAILQKRDAVDEETFLNALEMVLTARVVPAGRQFPYLYIDAKTRVVGAIINKVKEFLSKKETATEKLIEVLGSLSTPSEELLREALEEMISNPVAAAVFMRFLEQMLVSEHAQKFIEMAKEIPGLYKTLEHIARYEKIRM
jgi:hypothetical protein